MSWLAGNTIWWLLLAGLLGLLVTLFLSLRRVRTAESKTVTDERSSSSGADARGGAGVAGAGLAGAGVAGAGLGAATLAGTAGTGDTAGTDDDVDGNTVVRARHVAPEPVAAQVAAEPVVVEPVAAEPVAAAAATPVAAAALAPAVGDGSADMSADVSADLRDGDSQDVGEDAGEHTVIRPRFTEADAAAAAQSTPVAAADPLTAPLSEPEQGQWGPGSAAALAGGASPHPAYTIKGNADSMKYHPDDSPYYGRTVAEVWFKDEDSARAAGFVHWKEHGAATATSTTPAEPALPPEGPHGPGSAAPLEGGASPHPAYTIKGNADSMKYHPDDSPYYGRTVAEVWFKDEDAAQAAGFAHWKHGPATTTSTAPAEPALPPEGPHGPGSAAPLEGGASPHPAYTIKGNADSMKYHPDDSPYYGRTVAEVWFKDEDAARAAGFRHWKD